MSQDISFADNISDGCMISVGGMRIAVATYQKKLDKHGVVPQQCPDDQSPIVGKQKLAHCYYLLPFVITAIDEGEIGQARNLLSFIQGVLWDKNFYTLEQLDQHTEPPVTVFDASEEV